MTTTSQHQQQQQSASNSDRVLRKIKKLLAIAEDDSASDAEIQTAITHAQRMMDENHLTESDLAHSPEDDYAAVDAADFNDFRSFVGTRTFRWEVDLSQFVAEFVGCKVYREPREKPVTSRAGIVVRDDRGRVKYGKSFVFYGVAEDAAIASELYNELRTFIASMASAKFGQVYKGDGGTYSEGFVDGLFEAMRDQQYRQKLDCKKNAASNPNALVLIERRGDLVQYKQDKAIDWLSSERGIKLKSSRHSSGANGSSRAFAAGKSDGKNADVSATRRRKLTAK